MLELNEKEVRALDEFVSNYWNVFKGIALNFLSEDEVELLADKLSNSN